MLGKGKAADHLVPIRILGVRVDPLTVDDLHDLLRGFVSEDHHALVLNVNAHCMNLTYQQRWLREYLNQADVVVADGAGIQLAARLWGRHIDCRITYADWAWQLAELCAAEGFSLYFLGARPGVAEQAAARLVTRFPDLRIAGVQHGYFDKTPGGGENEQVIHEINAARPNILIVAFGMPLQECWLRDNWHRIEANVALTGGAVFDYISRRVARAPRWMTDNGLEWLGRLLIEPRRLWKRYLVGNPLFLWRVLKQRFGLLRFEDE